MNKRQKIKHLQTVNAKHIEARQELNRALNSAISDRERIRVIGSEVIQRNINLIEENFDLESENDRLKSELNKPLLSRLWRWKR